MLEIKDREELKGIVFEIIREHLLEKIREKGKEVTHIANAAGVTILTPEVQGPLNDVNKEIVMLQTLRAIFK